MQRIPSPAGAMVSYDKYGSGLPLVLVHGAFSDHKTNWEPGGRTPAEIGILVWYR